jgi:hypothetical protein
MIWSVHGLWGIAVSWNAFESTIYPHDTRKLLGLPWRVSTKYHPFVMTALLTFFNFSYFLPIGLLLGLYGERFMLSSSRLQRMEDDPGGVVSLLLMMSPSGYVKLSDACGGGRVYAAAAADDDDDGSGSGSGSGSRGSGSDGSEMYTMESGHVLGTAEAEIGDVPSAVDELLPRNDPAEAAALAAERRLQRQQRN